jgi:hypothetical protein
MKTKAKFAPRDDSALQLEVAKINRLRALRLAKEAAEQEVAAKEAAAKDAARNSAKLEKRRRVRSAPGPATPDAS